MAVITDTLRKKLSHEDDRGLPSHLCVCAGVPVRVVNKHSVASHQVHTKTTHPSRQNEYENGGVLEDAISLY